MFTTTEQISINETIDTEYGKSQSKNISDLEKLVQDQHNIIQSNAQTIEEYKSSYEQNVKELDLLKRQAADIQNTLKKQQERHQQEMEKVKMFSLQKFALSMLQIKDLLALSLNDESGDFELLKQAVHITDKEMVKALQSFGIEELDTKTGNILNPELEQAVAVVPNTGQQKNTIIEVAKNGYTLNGRLLVASKVIVAE